MPDDLDSRLARALAYFRLRNNQKSLDDFQAVIAKSPESVPARAYKIIVLGRLGKKADALSKLEKLQKGGGQEGLALCLAAVLAAELGEGVDKAFEALDAAIRKQPKDASLRYDAARAFSLSSRAISGTNKAMGRQLEQRCLQLLQEAIKNDDADFGRMDEDPDLDPIRDTPEFAELMKRARPDRRYAALWTSDASFEAVASYELNPAVHLQKCRELIAGGYRPVSCSVSRTPAAGPFVTASVWHRPMISEEVKDRLAERQARAAVALVRMGKAEEVWPLLRYSVDPRVRSIIISWLKPLGADPSPIAAEFDRIAANAQPAPALGQHPMDMILYHPDTSMRRALIQALGTYGSGGSVAW